MKHTNKLNNIEIVIIKVIMALIFVAMVIIPGLIKFYVLYGHSVTYPINISPILEIMGGATLLYGSIYMIICAGLEWEIPEFAWIGLGVMAVVELVLISWHPYIPFPF